MHHQPQSAAQSLEVDLLVANIHFDEYVVVLPLVGCHVSGLHQQYLPVALIEKLASDVVSGLVDEPDVLLQLITPVRVPDGYLSLDHTAFQYPSDTLEQEVPLLVVEPSRFL